MRIHVLVSSVVASLALCMSAQAATFSVNTTADLGTGASNPCTSGGAGCSLRRAVIAANNAPGSTIDVPAGTYTLTITGQAEDLGATGDLDVTQPVTIAGAGPDQTVVDGNQIDRVFEVLSDISAGTVSISGITITNGNPGTGNGGGINAGGTGSISIANSAITGNGAQSAFGGGFMDDQTSGALTVANSTFSGNGGARTTGGGLWTSAQSTIVNSTFSGNTSDNGNGSGGGIHFEAAPSSTVTNSTVAFNTAPADTAAGIYAFNGVVAVRNSIVSGNSGGNCDASALPTSQGNNIDDGATCGFTQASDHQNTNPQLGPLQGNGGPTQTHALPKGSPAVDAGDNAACPLADQRGQARPFDGNDDGLATCDIGAFELRGPPPAVTTGSPGDVTSTGALLGGVVNPNGFAATYHFDFGTTPAYGSATPSTGAGAGAADAPVAAAIAGLTPSTTYHYRLVASNAGGSATGADAAFTTAAAPGLGPPQIGVSANVLPLKGAVYVALPAVQSAGGTSARAVASRRRFGPFTRLRRARQIPIGSLLKTDHGTVRMTTARDTVGHTQFGDFSKGTFIATQSKRNPLTTATLTGSNLNACSRLPRGGAPKALFAARRHRSLFSNVHGRFRTRGRNAAATVRGTAFLVKDTCTGTLVTVRRGTVTVRDYRLRKDIRVKAHHRYFARAPVRRRTH